MPVVRVGVIGGGQLARMMIPPAVNLGIDLRVLAETEGMAASLAATAVGDYHDVETVLAFARDVDVITFDHEHVPQDVLHALVDAGVPVHPGPDALLFAQDKLLMRQKLSDLGLPVPAWARVETEDELQDFLDANGGHAVVKTPRGGYDGKGVRVVSAAHEASDWFTTLAEHGAQDALLVEEFVDFRRELAQLSARRPSGELVLWPVVESIQRDGVCAEVLAPAPGSAGRIADVAAQIAADVATGLGVTGVFAVELFETQDDRLLINELAMRPHNSGHWTQDGSTTSQFEQHLRAVLDLPLGATGCTEPHTVMVNILGGPADGALADRYSSALGAHPTAKIHNYGKDPRPGRKVGHVNASGSRLDVVAYEARAAAAFFQN
ncbi:5-(carboxyamino)imidazole ribonucleotide synthase [Mycetocola manganoxydans]|uniref:5-(carboxyamino)imidazole ribonucleotide synthase n=1 Tax=Mycetocola manganoxydans TaxID=699879 RepID=UPI00217E111E|nr:5-(carboxyamino)imidazole ribonucleotide synthase [Mycetocola manganoxydans]